ncbi:MAG: 3-hydroxyacyl-CoA dehydrogenase NAD-binding domain-containing protein [Desulfobacterales bacterium]
MSKLENIAVIGAGMMGHGIAQIFALHGHPVALMDLQNSLLSQAIENIQANRSLMAQRGIVSSAEISIR